MSDKRPPASSMGLPKKAKGGSKSKSKGGKDKDSKPKEPKKPQITVSNARMPSSGAASLTAARQVMFLPQLGSLEAHVVACRPGAAQSLGAATDISGVWLAKQLLLLSQGLHS